MAINKKFIDQFVDITSKAALADTFINLSTNFLFMDIKLFYLLNHLVQF